MRIDIMTLFPEMCEAVINESIIGRARQEGIIEIECHNIRDYTKDKHRRVDDYPYGGGMGMIMQAQPIADCYKDICRVSGKKPKVIYMSPQGKVFNQQKAKELAQYDSICILCGHYEGVDQRIIDELVDEEISIGDFVLTGGELPALMVTDAVARMVPGVLAEEESFTDESHYSGLLEYPQYTRPPVYKDQSVPEVLLSGHHANIKKWRRAQSIETTMKKRPDMLKKAGMLKDDLIILDNLLNKDHSDDKKDN